MNTLFIFFGGHNMANAFWNYDPIINKDTGFITKLQNIGNIYMHQPTYYNICYYDDKNEKLKKYYTPELNFKIDDISFKKQAQIAYNEIIKMNKINKYKYYIIICTSFGIHYAIELQKLLDIKLLISIEGSPVGENAKINFFESIKKFKNNYKSYNNTKIEILKKNKSYDELNDFISCKLSSMINFSMTKFDIPSLHFQNLIINDELNKKDNDKNLLKINTSTKIKMNDPLYKCIWLINKTHQSFWTDHKLIIRYIIDELKCNNIDFINNITSHYKSNNVILYHGSPIDNIKILKKHSYVTLFPHIAYIMGLYHKETKKTWTDDDLKKPYNFGKNIYFKKKCIPYGIPTLYIIKTNWSNVIIKSNFPFEMMIKDETTVEILKNNIDKKIKNSEKLLKYYEKNIY